MEQDTPLPVLRPDLEFIPGGQAADGSPTITIYDPLARSYDRFSWVEMAVIRQLFRPITLDQLYLKLKQETTADLSKEGIVEICKTLVQCGLTTGNLFRKPEELVEEKKRSTPGVWKWLLHHYLYFRVPLLRPDAFLEKTLPLARPFASRPAFFFYLLCGLIGLVFVAMEHERFFHTFPYFFNLKGVLCYGLAITVIKTIHEFSHAYTAKARGLRVPVMGIAFIVMWPVAFCDVTDGWRLAKRSRRLPVAAAGVIAELIIAGMALVGWSLSQPGIMQSLFFVVCTASLLSTLLVNINPAMSFDGYYMLMDISGVDNLRSRAFAHTSYLFRKFCIGMALTAPENVTTGRRWFYLFYSVYAWTYRFFLYLSIAALVYYEFTKVLGIFLFFVEIGWFIVMPIAREIMTIGKMRKLIQITRSSAVFFALLFVALLWLVVPHRQSYYVPAVVEADNIQLLYAPFAGLVTGVNVQRDKEVRAGEVLLEIASPALDAAISSLSIQRHIDSRELELLFLRENFSAIPEKTQEQQETNSRLRSLQQNARQYQVPAQIPGRLVDWDTSLKTGSYVYQHQVFGRIVDMAGISVAAYLPEEKIMDVAVDDRVRFYPRSGGANMAGTISRIHPSKVHSIPFPALTSAKGGDIPVVESGSGEVTMLDTRYLVEIQFNADSVGLVPGMSGEVRMKTRPVSVLQTMWNRAWKIMIRESNF